MYIQDNYSRFAKKEAEEQEWLESLPTCEYCGEKIQDEFAFYVCEEWYCEKCAKPVKPTKYPNGSIRPMQMTVTLLLR